MSPVSPRLGKIEYQCFGFFQSGDFKLGLSGDFRAVALAHLVAINGYPSVRDMDVRSSVGRQIEAGLDAIRELREPQRRVLMDSQGTAVTAACRNFSQGTVAADFAGGRCS